MVFIGCLLGCAVLSCCAVLLCCAAVQLWRQHWDFQLYKALDVQYRVGLESINKTLPEVNRKSLSGFSLLTTVMSCHVCAWHWQLPAHDSLWYWAAAPGLCNTLTNSCAAQV
jgi:hypothetical protein